MARAAVQNTSPHDSAVPAGSVGKGLGTSPPRRIKMTHRYFDLQTATEVLRRSPLPERHVRRKVRQLVEARLGGKQISGGVSGDGSARGQSPGRYVASSMSSIRTSSSRSRGGTVVAGWAGRKPAT